MCRVKWNNTLPDIPFDPKFITYPFDSDRFTKYKATSLEKEFKHDLLTEYDLGVTIDLITPDAYGPGAGRDPEDERLLDDETSGLSSTPGHHNLNEKRSRQHNKVVPWLKKTEYISTEFNRYGASSENNETKVGYNVQKKFKEVKESMICMDKESQIAAINRTFEEAKKPIRQHHSKKGVTPVEILPVFPDFDFWKMPFAQVSFDAEPVAVTNAESEKQMCEAMIRGVQDSESGEQFVAYFLPTAETLQKRERDAQNGVLYDPEDKYEYKQTREYTWSVKNKSTRGYDQNYFFVVRNGAVYYNELETRVKLTKRRNKTGPPANSKLVVTHREPNEMEMRTQQLREQQLKPNIDEEDNAGDEEEEEDSKKKATSRESSPDKETKSRKRKGSASSSSSSSSSDSGSESSSSESSSDSETQEPTKKRKKSIASDDSS